MVFVLTITLWALVLQIRAALRMPLGLNAATMNGVVGAVLLALALYIGFQSALSSSPYAAAVTCLTRIGEPPSRQGLGVSGAPRTGSVQRIVFRHVFMENWLMEGCSLRTTPPGGRNANSRNQELRPGITQTGSDIRSNVSVSQNLV